ncbi:DUF4129 domain-containing protein [Neobacillus terrae]|uniref:DUF4129 domain-containing protein n=1 Tax=Neobacillus terrae TaxID=3034837 RepID=UPI00140AD077|nr:DUF4129 domain-containing protein [Neobacillus terrae]NHM34023.1 DUF4129 domain-containing protein [Neobacillus terrae]
MLDENKARSKLERILDGKEYQVYSRKGFLEKWWESAQQWIAEQLAKLFPSFESANLASGPILMGLIVIFLLLMALTVFFLFRRSRRNRWQRTKKPLSSSQEINWTFQQHLDEAQRLEADEEYTRATRHLFLALLLYFHKKEWLQARIWKTNWDYYEELRKIDQQLASQFSGFTSFFDEVAYGEKTAEREEYFAFRSTVMKWLEETNRFQEPLPERGQRSQ